MQSRECSELWDGFFGNFSEVKFLVYLPEIFSGKIISGQ
jgi:hypothetical protein